MARNQRPLISPNGNPRPEFTRADTTAPTMFTGEIPRHLPVLKPEFYIADNIPDLTINRSGDVQNVSPNPRWEFRRDGYTTPTPLADTNLIT